MSILCFVFQFSRRDERHAEEYAPPRDLSPRSAAEYVRKALKKASKRRKAILTAAKKKKASKTAAAKKSTKISDDDSPKKRKKKKKGAKDGGGKIHATVVQSCMQFCLIAEIFKLEFKKSHKFLA